MIKAWVTTLIVFLSLGWPMATAKESSQPSSEARAVDLARVFPFWEDYVERSGSRPELYDQFELAYRVHGPEGWSIWLETVDGQFEELAAWPDQYLTAPPLAAFDRDASLLVDAPAGSMTVSMAFAPVGSPTTRYEADRLRESLAQANRAQRRAAGLLAPLAPRLDAVAFVFDRDDIRAWVTMSNGDREELNVRESRLELVLERQHVEITFTAAPLEAILTKS
jgi:hypothetical protein